MDSSFPVLLKGGIWHTTSINRFESILKDGALLPEPDLPDSERWGTKMGPAFYPFVRSLNGVSLFDFKEFNEIEYSEKYPLSSWSTFVPCNKDWIQAVWIKIDERKLDENFYNGNALLALWKMHNSSRRIMPLIEAAHIGPLPTSYFELVFIYDKVNGFKKSF